MSQMEPPSPLSQPPDPEIIAEKRSMRSAMRARVGGLSPADLAAASAALCARLESAEALKVMQMSSGASQARSRCAILWRQ